MHLSPVFDHLITTLKLDLFVINDEQRVFIITHNMNYCSSQFVLIYFLQNKNIMVELCLCLVRTGRK